MKKISNLQIINDKDRKQLLLNILDKIFSISKNNNIRCYLHAGTLLGAVRHKGFIPWDDDIDVSMPRPDYEKFKEIFSQQKNDNYYISDYNNMKYYPTPFIKVCIKDTEAVINNKRCGYGVGVDVFPIDGYPESENERNIWFEKQKEIFFNKYMFSVFFELYGFSCNTRNPLKYLKSYLFARLRNKKCNSQKGAKLVDESSKRNLFENSEYAGCSVGIFRKKIELAKRSSFDYGIPMEFEGKTYFGPIGYDDILKSIYGSDYMIPPPEDKRITTHEETFFWTNTK